MTGRIVVLSPAPTANGDLHLGHLAGPFLAADVYTRYARAVGREVVFGTGIQDTQTYVVTTARRLGVSPEELAARSSDDVRATLAAVGIEVDGFTGAEERFTKVVLNFLDRLHVSGRLRLRTMLFPYLPRTGEYLVDGHVRGECPVCLADGCAGLCESCGHPIAAGDLRDPRSTRYPDDPVELRPVKVMVLPVAEYADRLRAYLGRLPMRPHLAAAVEEILFRPLADFPVTFPVSWGIPAPFPETPNQVVNPFAETMAWSIYCTALAAEGRGAVLAADDELWYPDAGSTVAYFLGFDNTYAFAVAGIALLLAHGDRYHLPDHFVTNEFYELDNQKFSTSRGHVVWGRDLVDTVPRDLVRFHLAATSPELQRTNFSGTALATITETRLVQPWNAIATKVDSIVDDGPLPVSAESRSVAARIVARFVAAYELPGFSLNRAAETLAGHLARLARHPAANPGDFCHEVDVVLRCAAPILIDLAAQVLPDTAIPVNGSHRTEIVPRRLPRLIGTA